MKLQVRLEVFNLLNRTNFLGEGGNGVVTAMNPASVGFDTADTASATKITGYTLPGNFGQATAARDPRQVQVGLKLMF